MAQELLDNHAESLVRKCVLMAMQGNEKAMQLCIDRIVPTRRSLPVRLGKTPVGTAAELSQASEKVMHHVTAGRLTIPEGQALAELLERRRQVIETQDIDQRLRNIEVQQ